jgi:hypothetical protein
MNAMPGMPMDAMPGMPMDHQLMICPVVLVLIAASAVLALTAIVLVRADADGALTCRTLARGFVRLPVARVVAVLSAFAVVAVAAMVAVDGAGVPSAPACALLAALLLGGAFVSVVAAVMCAHVALAFGQRVLVGLIAAILARPADPKPFAMRRSAWRVARMAHVLLAAGCGLRAPPSFVR